MNLSDVIIDIKAFQVKSFSALFTQHCSIFAAVHLPMA